MRCPDCGARADVKDTRHRKDGAKTRRYLCHNMHKFSTLEVYAVANRHDHNRLEVKHELARNSPRPKDVG